MLNFSVSWNRPRERDSKILNIAPSVTFSFEHKLPNFETKTIAKMTSPYSFFLLNRYEARKKNKPKDGIDVNELAKDCAKKWTVSHLLAVIDH